MIAELVKLAGDARKEGWTDLSAVLCFAGSIYARQRPDLMKKLCDFACELSAEANGESVEFPPYIPG